MFLRNSGIRKKGSPPFCDEPNIFFSLTAYFSASPAGTTLVGSVPGAVD